MKKIQKYCRLLCLLSAFLLLFAVSPVMAEETEERYQTENRYQEDIFTYTVSNNTATITNVEDSRDTVIIPEKLGDYPVTALAAGACGGSTKIQKIVIPDSVREIGSMCFAYSSKLQEITLPTSLKKIENGVFSQCIALHSITIPSGVASIGKDAFYRCDNLWTITLPDSVTKIGENAFAACPNLAAATIPAGVTEIAPGAFVPSGGFRIYAKPGTAAQAFAAENNITFEELITVRVNDTPVTFDQPPITDTRYYRTLVPMRAVLTALGAEVSWDNNMNLAGIDLGGNRLLIRVGEPFMMVNGSARPLSSPAIEFNCRVLLPIRDVIESIHGRIRWNEDLKQIDVTVPVQ